MTAPPPFAKAMLAEAARLRAAAEAAFLPAVRSQLMARVQEYENAATGD
jgi:hypothetical protein